MPQMNRMKEAIESDSGETVAERLPKLIELFKTPVRVAAVLGVYPNAVRNGLLRLGYHYDHEKREWVKEAEHA